VCDVTDHRLEEEEESAMASVSESRIVGEEDAVKSDEMTTSGQCSGGVEMLVVLPAAGSATLGIRLGLEQWSCGGCSEPRSLCPGPHFLFIWHCATGAHQPVNG
jgi:hypothetical protein